MTDDILRLQLGVDGVDQLRVADPLEQHESGRFAAVQAGVVQRRVLVLVAYRQVGELRQ